MTISSICWRKILKDRPTISPADSGDETTNDLAKFEDPPSERGVFQAMHDISIPAHFTASAVVIYHGHILLIHHKRIGAWLPPGGHLDQGELPHQACLREVLEETGLECQIVSDPVPLTRDPDGYILPAPLCMHRVLAHEKGAPVVHIDLAYLCRPLRVSDGPLPDLRASAEVWGARWVEISHLSTIELAKNVSEIVQMALEKLGSDL